MAKYRIAPVNPGLYLKELFDELTISQYRLAQDLGVSKADECRAIAIDSERNVYVTGVTYSSNFPATSGTYDTSFNGGSDAFVSKFNGNLTSF